MGIFCGIVLLAVFFLLITVIFTSQKECKYAISFAFIGATSMILLVAGIFSISEYCSPSMTPIDVYRGRTTLEITYKDGIAIDSVVVWKEEVK